MQEVEEELSLVLRAKYFKDYKEILDEEEGNLRGTTIGYESLCLLSDAYQDNFNREADFQVANDHTMGLVIDCTATNELEEDVVYMHKGYEEEDFLSDYKKAKKLKWSDSIIRTIVLKRDHETS